MEQTECPTDITGCRFTVAVMSDDFVPKILGAIKNVDTGKVWAKTDTLSTVYRGKRVHVMDCLKACFAHLNDGQTHITMEAAVSKGCPNVTDSDKDIDNDSHLAEDDVLLNNTQKKFNVSSKISFYPLGITDYMDHIAHIVKMGMDKGLCVETAHYAMLLRGDINELFSFFDLVLAYAEQNISHYVLRITLSANSPSENVQGAII